MSDAVRYSPTPANDRRFKAWFVPDEQMLAMLFDLYGNPEVCNGAKIKTLKLSNAPEGYRILRVCHMPHRMCWGFLVWHPDFPEVPLGGNPEHVDYDVELITLGTKVD